MTQAVAPIPTEAPPAGSPDWATLHEDVRCPLCDYDLRGLTEPRCPECGYRFDLQFDRPIATAASAQLIVLLVAWVYLYGLSESPL